MLDTFLGSDRKLTIEAPRRGDEAERELEIVFHELRTASHSRDDHHRPFLEVVRYGQLIIGKAPV